MADRLHTLMTEELARLVTERDDYRVKSIQYKEAAEKIDKQVNRLQHFLTDYDKQDFDIPEKTGKKVNRNGNGNGRAPMGAITKEILSLLQDVYPQSLPVRSVKDHLSSKGMHMSGDTMVRLVDSGRVEKAGKNLHGVGYVYRFVLEGMEIKEETASAKTA